MFHQDYYVIAHSDSGTQAREQQHQITRRRTVNPICNNI
jgi:hypothetical protein